MCWSRWKNSAHGTKAIIARNDRLFSAGNSSLSSQHSFHHHHHHHHHHHRPNPHSIPPSKIPRMSTAMITALPLGKPSDIISSDSDMLAAWEAIDHWHSDIIQHDDKKRRNEVLRVVAGHIQLACKILSTRLKKFANEQEDGALKMSAMKTLQRVHNAAKSVRTLR